MNVSSFINNTHLCITKHVPDTVNIDNREPIAGVPWVSSAIDAFQYFQQYSSKEEVIFSPHTFTTEIQEAARHVFQCEYIQTKSTYNILYTSCIDFENKYCPTIIVHGKSLNNQFKRILQWICTKYSFVDTYVSDIYDKHHNIYIYATQRHIKQTCEQYDNLLRKICFVLRKRKCLKRYWNKNVIIKKIKQNQIVGLKWCMKHRIPINMTYLSVKNTFIPSNLNKINRLFPKCPQSHLLKLTKDSVYSVSPPQMAEDISRCILHMFPSCKTILDATANIGGNTINFAKHFKHVRALDICPTNIHALKNNIKVYKLKNVVCARCDFVEVMTTITEDVVFIDPPWGGRYYKVFDKLRLNLSNISLEDIVNSIPTKVHIVLKLPLNYDIESFEYNTFRTCTIVKFEKYQLILL